MNTDELLSALLAGDLAPSEAEEVRARIDREPELAARWAEMLSLVEALDDLPLPDVPDDLIAKVVRPDRADPSEGPPSGNLPRWWGYGALAAAFLLGLGLGRLTTDPDGPEVGYRVVIDGAGSLSDGALRVEVDGRAEVERPVDLDEPVSVEVETGNAMVLRDGERLRIGASERWTSEPPSPMAPSAEEVRRATEDVERLEAELEAARARVRLHEGVRLAWPDDLPALLAPSRFPAAVREAVEEYGQGTVLAVDCTEYPCAAVLYAEHPYGVDLEWAAALYSLTDQLPEPWDVVKTVRTEERGEVEHDVAIVSVLPPAFAVEHGDRLLFRARRLIEAHQPAVMREPLPPERR